MWWWCYEVCGVSLVNCESSHVCLVCVSVCVCVCVCVCVVTE